MKRMIIIVLDSVGIGELPDSRAYGDEGSDTLGHIARDVQGFRIPNLQKLGLANIDGVSLNSVEKAQSPAGLTEKWQRGLPGRIRQPGTGKYQELFWSTLSRLPEWFFKAADG
jgi:phosphopentomutase